MAYFAVAYGNAIRCEQAPTEHAAVRLAFGVEKDHRSTVCRLPRSVKQMSRKVLLHHYRRLAVQHFRRTGSVSNGWEKEPGIANIHWTECQLCKGVILTEPKSKGFDSAICDECAPKYLTLSEIEKDDLSIVAMREKLGIKMKHGY